MITIVDLGTGNLGSVRNMLTKIGVESQISHDPDVIARADKLVLPGVGAFDSGMESLDGSRLRPILEERVLRAGVPILGICLGMQLMTRGSQEGTRPGLGWIDAEAIRFPSDGSLKVPHMGWNVARPARPTALTESLPEQARFYFVHSFYVRCRDDADVMLTTTYGDDFHSGFHRDNVWGVQFHPEKSHRFGMELFGSFAQRC